MSLIRTSTFLLLVLSVVAMAQAQQPAAVKEGAEAPGTISGRVVSDSGEPVPNALVHVRTFNAPNAHTTRTDRDGSFQVNNLDPAAYFVSAMAPAYITPPRESSTNPPQTYRPGETVTLTLIKGGVITGTVSNATGEPVVWIGVRVQMVRDADGRVLPRGVMRESPTDDRGIYRVYGLMPGTYVVSAGGPSELTRSSLFMNAFGTDAATYAPSSWRDEAAEIKVRAGEEVAGVDIRYRAEPGRTISGEVRLPPNTDTRFSVVLTAAGEGGGRWQSEAVQSPGSQSFSFSGIRDGDYDVIAQTYTQSGGRGVSEQKRISVRGADVTGIVLTAKPFGSVAGRLVIEETTLAECPGKERPAFSQTAILAWHNDNAAAKQTPQSVWSQRRPATPGPDGSFLLENLAAGEYMFSTRMQARYWYLRSVSLMPFVAEGAKAPGRPVDATRVWSRVKPGEKVSGLTVTLAHGAALLRGQLVVGEGEAFPRRMVVYLVPAERERADDVLRYFASPVYEEKNFGFDYVPPGRYWIIAESRPEGVTSPLSRIRYPSETLMRSRLRREAELLRNEIEFKPCEEVGHFKLPLKPTVQ